MHWLLRRPYASKSYISVISRAQEIICPSSRNFGPRGNNYFSPFTVVSLVLSVRKNIPQRPGVKNKSKTSQIQQVNNYYSYYLLRPKAMMASFLLMVTNRCLIEHYRTIYNRLVFRWIESMDDKSKMFLQLLFGNHHFKTEGFFSCIFLHFLIICEHKKWIMLRYILIFTCTYWFMRIQVNLCKEV